MRPLLPLSLLAAPALLAAPPATPVNGTQLLAAMHARYAATWYPTLTFTQKSIWYKPDGSEARVQTWHEALQAPGLLRIDMGDAPARDGAIFRHDSTYRFTAGKLAGATAERNLLLVLGFDVYKQPPSHTADVLRAEGIDLGTLHRQTFQGRTVYVVGAAAGDTLSPQFWVDARRLLFVRLIQPNKARTSVQDVRFNKYVRKPGGWLADQVQVLSGGKLVYEEDYSDVKVNMKLDPALFDPAAWATAPLWWK